MPPHRRQQPFRPLIPRILALFCGIAAFLAGSVALAEESAPPPAERAANEYLRPHRFGPLTDDDFQAPPPKDASRPEASYAAWLTQEIRWASRYQTLRGGKTWRAKVAEIQVFAAVWRDQSWNRRHGQSDAAVLDHEQGHFDINQTHAVRLEIEVRQKIAAGKPPQAEGKTEQEAVDKLKEILRQSVATTHSSATVENQEYDRQTTHGSDQPKQQEFRHLQKAALEKVAQELEALLAAKKTPIKSEK